MTTNKNSSDVTIAGKDYTLAGYEDAEYLQRIATYINAKISELRKTDGFMRQNADYRETMLLINIADDVFKQRTKVDELQTQIAVLEKELYNLKTERTFSQRN